MKHRIEFVALAMALSSLVGAVEPGSGPSPTNPSMITDSVRSHDGTVIGYRQYGHGPGLILVEGAMGTAYNYKELAEALAGDFTVYLPDRRGRGLTPKEFTVAYTIQNEIEDLNSLIVKTDSHFIFGLSSGAIIAMEATRELPSIQKAIIYEPPYQPEYSRELKERLNSEIGRGDLAAALVTLGKIVRIGPAILNYIPRPILEFMTGRVIRSEDEKGTGNYASLRELIPSTRFDVETVSEKYDKADSYKEVMTPVLLLGGSKSPRYLKDSVAHLEKVLPHADRVQLDGLDHSGPWNADHGGHPVAVADAIRGFLNK